MKEKLLQEQPSGRATRPTPAPLSWQMLNFLQIRSTTTFRGPRGPGRGRSRSLAAEGPWSWAAQPGLSSVHSACTTGATPGRHLPRGLATCEGPVSVAPPPWVLPGAPSQFLKTAHSLIRDQPCFPWSSRGNCPGRAQTAKVQENS